LVTSFLVNFFGRYLEYGFTADMEQFLDDISNGTKSRLDVLNGFWKEFHDSSDRMKDVKITDVINKLNESMTQFLFSDAGQISRQCPDCNEGELSLKIGRFGSFIGCSRYPECNFVRKLDSSPITDADASMLTASEYPKFLGMDDNTNEEVFLKKGPYGLYLEKNSKTQESENGAKKKKTAKPPRASVPKFVNPDQIDMKLAEFLFDLPKTIGHLDGNEIRIGIGRYGPYVLFKGKYVSIPKAEDILTITVEEAIELIRKKKID